jgi:hypothetical protein
MCGESGFSDGFQGSVNTDDVPGPMPQRPLCP